MRRVLATGTVRLLLGPAVGCSGVSAQREGTRADSLVAVIPCCRCGRAAGGVRGRLKSHATVAEPLPLHTGALPDTGSLAPQLADVVQLGPTDPAAPGDLDLVDGGGMQREHPLDTYP